MIPCSECGVYFFTRDGLQEQNREKLKDSVPLRSSLAAEITDIKQIHCGMEA